MDVEAYLRNLQNQMAGMMQSDDSDDSDDDDSEEQELDLLKLLTQSTPKPPAQPSLASMLGGGGQQRQRRPAEQAQASGEDSSLLMQSLMRRPEPMRPTAEPGQYNPMRHPEVGQNLMRQPSNSINPQMRPRAEPTNHDGARAARARAAQQNQSHARFPPQGHAYGGGASRQTELVDKRYEEEKRLYERQFLEEKAFYEKKFQEERQYYERKFREEMEQNNKNGRVS